MNIPIYYKHIYTCTHSDCGCVQECCAQPKYDGRRLKNPACRMPWSGGVVVCQKCLRTFEIDSDTVIPVYEYPTLFDTMGGGEC